jgi:TRAP-type mannitol/chloroaromatic compound transport system permease small subunit
MSDSRKRVVQIFAVLFFLAPFCAVIVYSSFDYALTSFYLSEKSTDPGGLPYRYLLKSIIPLSFFVLLTSGLLGLFKKNGTQ